MKTAPVLPVPFAGSGEDGRGGEAPSDGGQCGPVSFLYFFINPAPAFQACPTFSPIL